MARRAHAPDAPPRPRDAAAPGRGAPVASAGSDARFGPQREPVVERDVPGELPDVADLPDQLHLPARSLQPGGPGTLDARERVCLRYAALAVRHLLRPGGACQSRSRDGRQRLPVPALHWAAAGPPVSRPGTF